MTDLSDKARAAMDQYRSEVSPTAATRNANWERFLERAASEDGPPEEVLLASTTPASQPRPRVAVVSAVVAAAAAVVAVTTVGYDRLRAGATQTPSSAVHQAGSPERMVVEHEEADPAAGPTRAVVQQPLEAEEDAASTTTPTEPSASQSSEDEGAAAPPDRSRNQSADRRTPAKRPQNSAKTASQGDRAQRLRQEAILLRRARAALRDGKPGAALSILDRHEREFDEGALTEFGQVLRADALCAAGQRVAARRIAKAFLQAHPDSSLAGRMRKICVSSETP